MLASKHQSYQKNSVQMVDIRVRVGVDRRGEYFLMENPEGSLEEVRFQLGTEGLKWNQKGHSTFLHR